MAATPNIVELGDHLFEIEGFPTDRLQDLVEAIRDMTLMVMLGTVTIHPSISAWHCVHPTVLVERLKGMMIAGNTKVVPSDLGFDFQVFIPPSGSNRTVTFGDIRLPHGYTCVNPQTILGTFLPGTDLRLTMSLMIGTSLSVERRQVPAHCFVKCGIEDGRITSRQLYVQSYGTKPAIDLIRDGILNLHKVASLK